MRAVNISRSKQVEALGRGCSMSESPVIFLSATLADFLLVIKARCEAGLPLFLTTQPLDSNQTSARRSPKHPVPGSTTLYSRLVAPSPKGKGPPKHPATHHLTSSSDINGGGVGSSDGAVSKLTVNRSLNRTFNNWTHSGTIRLFIHFRAVAKEEEAG